MELILKVLLIPFFGTSLGAACVFLLKHELQLGIKKALTGFAAGVMVAASVWSLLIPSMEAGGALAAVTGFWMGTFFLLFLDHAIPHLHINATKAEGPKSRLSKQMMLLLAVTLHNIPEGMAVGIVLAGWLTGGAEVSMGATLALAIGIAIQNFPEGAIVSMPLRATGMSRSKAFAAGVLSGIVEPLGGFAMVFAASLVLPVFPYLLAAAAGAMLYVVVEELIPEMSAGEHSDIGVLAFSLGFTLMMALDVLLGDIG